VTPEGAATVAVDRLYDGLDDLVGVRQPIVGWNTEAGVDAVRHFARGYGDDNPLWGLIGGDDVTRVPPTFLYTVCSGGREPGHLGPAEVTPGTGALWLGDTWQLERPVRIGSPLSATVTVDAVTRSQTRSRGPVAIVDERFTFQDDGPGPLATYLKRTMRFRRLEDAGTAAAAVADEPPAPHYDVETLDRLAAEISAEAGRRRGPDRRYAESVTVGDPLGSLVKGPLSVTSIVAWVCGWGSPYIETDRLAHQRWLSDPGLRLQVPSTGRPETIEGPHWEPELAASAGMDRGYDFAPQRIAWLVHLVTDWAGDHAQVRAVEARLRAPNLLGDLTTVTGRVTAVEDGLVSCDLVATNQRGQETATARVDVLLETTSQRRS